MKLIIVLALLCNLSLVHVNSQSTYTIDWSLAATTYPGDFTTDDTDIGQCICDLTIDLCDENCYCDSDCTATEQARFSETLNEGPVDYSVTKCLDDWLIDVNERGGIVSSLGDNMLCITNDNNPSKGEFINNPSTVSSSVFDTEISEEDYSYQPVDYNVISASTDVYYLVDDRIISAIDNSGTFEVKNGGYLSLPSSGFNGKCNDRSYARYLNDTSSSCQRVVSTLSTSCTAGTMFAGDTYGANLRVGTILSATPSTTDLYVVPTVTANTVVTTVTVGNTTTSSVPDPSYNSTTCTCSNVVTAADYSFTYELTGQITAVSVALTLGSVTGCGSDVTFAQSFTSTYLSALQASSGYNSTAEIRSGNPGYLENYPVLAGVLRSSIDSSTGDTIYSVAQYVNGLQLHKGDSNGMCSTDLSTYSSSVDFRGDVVESCYLSMTVTELETACTSGVLSYLAINATIFGHWGWADRNSQYDWGTIEQDTNTYPTTWNTFTKTCSGIVNAINLRLLYADYGSTLNVQRKILQVRSVYSTTDWSFDSLETTQRFPLFSTATWYKFDSSNIETYVPSSPPIAPSFPDDLLYPFYINSAPGGRGRGAYGTSPVFLSLVLPSAVCALIFSLYQRL